MKKCLSYTASIMVVAFFMLASTNTARAAENVTDTQINEYIIANIGNPAAIADAMKQYNVNLYRIQQATGSSTADITTYITNSGNPYLVAALNTWPPARSIPTALPPAPPTAPQVQPLPVQPSPAATPASAPAPGTELTAMKAQLKMLTDANYQAYDKIATCRQSGKSDCSAEINAFNAIRQPAFDLGAKIAVLEFESKTKADVNTDFLNVERASEATTSAFYTCLDTSQVTHTGCSSQGALALSIAEKTAAAARAVLEDCTATPNGNAYSCVAVRMQADAMTADVRAIEAKIADTNTVAQYAAAPVQSATPAPKPASVTPVTEFKLPVITATELTAMKAQLKALQDANTRAYDKIATCKQSGKSDCSAEINAFNAIRQPAFDLGAKIAAAELDSKKKGDVNADFLSMNEASYAATSAFYACLDTTKVTHAGCGTQAALAQTMAEKTAIAARAVLDACIAKPNANASSCSADRMQADAMNINIKAIEDRIAGSGDVAQYVSAPDQSIKPAAPPITIALPAEGKTKSLANGYTVDSAGQMKNAQGKVVGKLTDAGKFVDAAGKPVSAELANQYVALFTSPNTTAGSGIVAVKDATSKISAGSSYYGDNNNRDLGDEVKKVKLNITNAQIKDYITTHLQDPNAIANAMKQYNVDLSQIHDATGYTREQMADYIAKSNNAQLKSDLSKWTAAPVAADPVQAPTPIAKKDIELTTPGYRTPEPIATATAPAPTTAAPAPVTNAQIDNYVRANLDNPQNISSAMAQYNVNLEQIQSATGYTRDEMVDYINKSGDPALKASLSTWK